MRMGKVESFLFGKNSLISLSGISITGGFSETNGGGINNQGTLVVTNCTLFGNSAEFSGGAIANGDKATLVNSIIVGNSAQLYGAVWNMGEFAIINSTLTNNITQNTSGYNRTSASVMTVTNSILWQNEGALFEDQGSLFVANNLVGIDPVFVRDPSDGGDGWGDDPDTTDVDESTNDDYGDLRLTLQSPAINYGDNQVLPVDLGDLDRDGDQEELLPLDADENPRIYDETVDCGAFEFQNLLTDNREIPSLIVTTTSDVFDFYDSQISLREAIWYASTGSRGTKVTFDTSLDGATIYLAGQPIWIDKMVTVDASPLTSLSIDADEKCRVFTIGTQGDDQVKLIDLTITGGSAKNGGGIFNTGFLVIENCTLVDNSATNGGGIYNWGYHDTAKVSILNSTITNNNASSGGGIYNQDTMNLENCFVLRNNASSEVYNKRSLAINEQHFHQRFANYR